MRGEGRDHSLEGTVPPHAGRTIGLCSETPSAMSGEEVESMEQGKLAERVGQVGAPCGSLGEGWRGVFCRLIH